jgi:hypothetical protein
MIVGLFPKRFTAEEQDMQSQRACSSIVNRGLFALTLASSLLVGSSGLLQAQASDDSSEKKIVAGCWMSESTKESPGKCPRQVKDQAMLCLNESMAGGISGNYHTSRMSNLHIEKVAMEDITTCDAVGDVKMVDYDVAVAKSPKNVLLLSETHHKCGIGSCADEDKTTLKGSLGFDGDVLVFSRSDGNKLRFTKYQAPDSKSSPQ